MYCMPHRPVPMRRCCPRASKGQVANADIPLLYGDFDDRVLGDLASGLAGGPSNAMAVFAVTGADEQAVDAACPSSPNSCTCWAIRWR